MRLILLFLVFVSSILLASTIAFAGISTKRQDILKLIGTTEASNGKFAWVEINGEDYGWTREGRNVGKYRIVMVEMGKVKLELFGRIVELKLLPEDAIKKSVHLQKFISLTFQILQNRSLIII